MRCRDTARGLYLITENLNHAFSHRTFALCFVSFDITWIKRKFVAHTMEMSLRNRKINKKAGVIFRANKFRGKKTIMLFGRAVGMFVSGSLYAQYACFTPPSGVNIGKPLWVEVGGISLSQKNYKDRANWAHFKPNQAKWIREENKNAHSKQSNRVEFSFVIDKR